MKFRNKFVSKRIGTKTLASLLAFGMALGSPMAVFADDGETAVVAENTVQAKKTDGSEVFVSVSDYVRGMMERGAVRLNDETGYLEDTSTGQKVDPETGEHRKNQKLQKSRILRELQRHRKNQALRKIRIARIPANPIQKIRFRHRILIRQILPKTGKIQRPTQFREVRSTIHRRSAKQKKQSVRTNQKLQSVILN